ncbi:MAG: exopolysaccharide biosynthesis protein [Actinomycetota bacterium]|nr:exopolysaccharide biosynthesis protein [Actinomycetota bacterium]
MKPPSAADHEGSPTETGAIEPGGEMHTEKVSHQVERWLRGDQPKTLGSLIDLFGERGFAIVFVLLMAVPALPLPTGGATHVLEVITALLALELIVGRREIWLPQRWQQIELAGPSRQKFINALLKRIRWFERFSRPRGRWLFNHRLSGVVFGLAVLALTAAAFLAPPFSGLDTLPAIGVVVLALGVLLEDFVLVVAGLVVGVLGVVAEVTLGTLVVKELKQLF